MTNPAPGATNEAAKPETLTAADMLLGSNRFRMQCRIDACLERHGGDVNVATTSSGIGISYGFARDIVNTFDQAEVEIARLRTALREARALIAAERCVAVADHECFLVTMDGPGMRSMRTTIERYDAVLAQIDEVLATQEPRG